MFFVHSVILRVILENCEQWKVWFERKGKRERCHNLHSFMFENENWDLMCSSVNQVCVRMSLPLVFWGRGVWVCVCAPLALFLFLSLSFSLSFSLFLSLSLSPPLSLSHTHMYTHMHIHVHTHQTEGLCSCTNVKEHCKEDEKELEEMLHVPSFQLDYLCFFNSSLSSEMIKYSWLPIPLLPTLNARWT